MKIIYQNEWDYTNIHVDLPIPYEEDYQVKMINYNEISGLLPVHGIGKNGQSRYTFRLENGMSMDKIYEEEEMRGKEIEEFIDQLFDIEERIKALFLNPNHIILDPKLIFKKENKYYFCYLPIIRQDNEKTICRSFHELTEYFVKRLDYKDTQGVAFVLKMHRETLKEHCDLKKLTEECKKERMTQAEEMKRKRTKIEDTEESISEKLIFSPGEELRGGRKETEICHEEQSYMKGKSVKRIVEKIKGDRWGSWDDLITEIDGQSTSGIL